MTGTSKLLIGTALLAIATSASAEITLYQGEGFRGRAVTTTKQMVDIPSTPLGDRAGSVVVGSGEWQVCDRPGFGGRCAFVRNGSYDSVSEMGLNYGIASVRAARRGPPPPEFIPPPANVPVYEYRQRPGERIYEVPVRSVRAVVGPPERRCWVEREQVVEREEPSAKGAAIGAIIGGVLGHKVSHGDDAGTVGGALAGAAIGANVGRDEQVYDQDVQRCADVPPGPPEFWDVTYEFHGAFHHVQMSAPPGPTIMVNRNGEPRQ
jgi:uncharacterized protein YcfJ